MSGNTAEETHMSEITRRNMLRLMTMLASTGTLASARAQPLPALAKIFVGFPPGSSPDLVARRLGESLRGRLASAIVVDNRPGAGGRIAVDAAMQAPADGLNLLLNPAGVLTLNPLTYRQLGYRPFEDLTPIGLACTVELAFAVGPAVPDSVKSLTDFATWVKERPGKISYASPAAGATPHFVGFTLDRKLSLGMLHVPYRGGGQAISDALGGRVESLCLVLADLLPHARAGSLRILAVTGKSRSRFAPNVPTFVEQGVPALDMLDWFGVYLAGRLAPDTVKRLAGLVQEATSSVEYVQSLATVGLEAVSSTPEELDRLARSDLARWTPLVRAANFMVDN
jgi:tripartite-type tricarboxylate transporter receptor subunit TctC